jgi:stage IV sporulation protein FB
MKWSFSIGRIAGIDVRLHATFLLLVALLGWLGFVESGLQAAVVSVVFVTLLFLCVLLHEFGHALAARRYGIRTPDITLLPIGGVARLERMPDNPTQELVISIAGPLVNVAIAIVLWIILGAPGRLGDFLVPSDHFGALLERLLSVNVMLVAFNLIPAFPMDGGRVLRAILALRLGHVAATRIAARVGQALAVGLVLVGVFGIPGWVDPNFFLIVIALFVFSGAQQEAAYTEVRAAVAGMRVADAMITRFQTFAAGVPADLAADEALRDTQPIYPVLDPEMKPLGLVARNVLLKSATGPVEALAQDVPAVPADASFDEAFQLMQKSGSPVLPVVNPAGQLVGLVSLHLLSERARRIRA